jgi:hypothetical protein
MEMNTVQKRMRQFLNTSVDFDEKSSLIQAIKVPKNLLYLTE